MPDTLSKWEQERLDQHNAVVESTRELAARVDIVASFLPGQWSVDITHEIFFDTIVRLNEINATGIPTQIEFVIKSNPGANERGKIVISGGTPKDLSAFTNRDWPTAIMVSITKTNEQISKDILKRLLPELSAAQTRASERYNKHQTHLNGVIAKRDELMQLANGYGVTNDEPLKLTDTQALFSIYNYGGVYVDFSGTIGGLHFNLSRAAFDHELAKRIVPVIAAYLAENDVQRPTPKKA